MSEAIPMILTCPACNVRHIDAGEFATKPHHTHACQSCGMVWRPALVPTVGVQYLPGFKDEPHMIMPYYMAEYAIGSCMRPSWPNRYGGGHMTDEARPLYF